MEFHSKNGDRVIECFEVLQLFSGNFDLLGDMLLVMCCFSSRVEICHCDVSIHMGP